MAAANKDDTRTEGAAEAPAKTGAPSHIRFVGHPTQDENSHTDVFGKRFFRGKWVPLSNLDGGNPEKKALPPEQLAKLVANPAFQLGNGVDTPLGIADAEGALEVHEEA